MTTPIQYIKNPALRDQVAIHPLLGVIEENTVYVLDAKLVAQAPHLLVEVPSTQDERPLESNDPPKTEELTEPSPTVTESPLETPKTPGGKPLESRSKLPKPDRRDSAPSRPRGRPKMPTPFAAQTPTDGHWAEPSATAELQETHMDYLAPNRVSTPTVCLLTEAKSARGSKGKT